MCLEIKGGWYYLLPQVVGLRSYAKVTHYAFDVLSKEYEQKCWVSICDFIG